MTAVEQRREIPDETELLIIGGGVTGAGIALDAASRGIRAVLVEKQDFAAGTSSRSTKLIHGGLRYLKQLDWRLVRETGTERAIVHRIAPHIVVPEKMLLPIVKGGTYGSLLTSAGLWIYDRLAHAEPSERRIMLDAAATTAAEPLLRKDILLGGGMYYEYHTDDNRLVMDLIRKAEEFGAKCFNYTEWVEPVRDENGNLCGALLKDLLTGKETRISARVTVNATGPWTDEVLRKENALTPPKLRHTKGVHLVFAHARFPLQQAVYFDVPDGRMVFAIPRDGITYVGTTDTDYKGRLEEPGVTEADIAYLLEGIANMFPSVRLTREDVISTWSGVRPLVMQPGRKASEVSRRDEVFLSPSGMITITGGKLTGYRKMAERVTDRVCVRIGRNPVPVCRTDTLSLGEIASDLPADFPPHFRQYGKRWAVIRDLMKAENPDVISAEAVYAIRHEHALYPEDFCIRRTGDLYFRPTRVKENADAVVAVFARLHGWDEAEKKRRAEALRERVALVSSGNV